LHEADRAEQVRTLTMTRRPFTRRGVATATAAALGLILAGGVGAVAVSKSTAVRACADSHDYLVTATRHGCPKGTHAMKLGISGRRGARGVRGKPGSNGLSQVYVGVAPQGAVEHLTNSYATELAIPGAAVGNYVVNWSVLANNANETANAGSEPECAVVVNGTIVGSLQATTLPSAAVLGGTLANLAQTQVVSLASPGEIDLQCDLALGTNTNVLGAELNATRVDTVTPKAS
jgi:hypothetical protein